MLDLSKYLTIIKKLLHYLLECNMCGFLVCFSKKNKISKDVFKSSLDLLSHRGNDGKGITSFLDEMINMGHVRLKVVGKENGEQPIKDESGELCIVINGEFYDYKESWNDFEKKGYKFTTDSDSEIIIPLYKEYGECFLTMLNGEFSGVLWDDKKGEMIAFRDRHGVKPLYYSETEEHIIFSSEIKSILNLVNKKPKWNKKFIQQSIALINQQDLSAFDGIKQLSPGHYLKINIKSGTLEEKEYWAIDFNRSNYVDLTFKDIINKYESEFIKSISRRIFTDVPVAVYLSGGIDSASCYGVSCSLAEKGLDAFTISFEHPAYDELQAAKSMVEKYNGQHHVIKINDQMLVDKFEEHLWYTETPCINPHSVAKYLLSKEVNKAGFKVVITGEGADEYNGGYPLARVDAIKEGIINGGYNISDANFGSMMNMGSTESKLAKNIFGFSPSLFENAMKSASDFDLFYAKSGGFQSSESLINDIILTRHSKKMHRWDNLNTSLHLTAQSSLSYILCVLGDRVEMANTVEARLPFLDKDLVEFMATVPAKLKFSDDMDKPILRAAMEKYVTPEIYKTRKHPFLAPPLIKKGSPFSTYMYDVFSSHSFLTCGLFNQRMVLRELSIPSNDIKLQLEKEKKLFFILSIAILHDKFCFLQ